MTKKTKAPQREGVTKATAPVREGLAFLIEDALERSEVVIAAESIVEKLQGMAEDLSQVEAKDIMPLFDSLTNAFGPQVAQNFNNVATEQIRNLIGAVQTAKSSMDNEIIRLKKAVEGGDVSDMGMDTGAEPMMPGAAPGEAPLGPDTEAPLGAEAGLSDVPPDMAGNTQDDSLAVGGNFAGREKKIEGRKQKGGKIAEDMATPHTHESPNFPANVANLAVFNPNAGRLAQAIANQIRTKELSLEQRKGLASVLSNIAAFGHESAHWSGIDPSAAISMKLKAEHISEGESPVVEQIVGELRKLAYLLNLHHDRMLEANIALLRKAANPDAIILKTFRTKLAEHRDSQLAAIRTARTYAIDIEDVVAVVKEAAARRPFKLAEKIPSAKRLQITRRASDYFPLRTNPADNMRSPPVYTPPPRRQATSAGPPRYLAKEDAPPLMQGVPMFPIDSGTSQATGTGTPNPVPNTPPDPNRPQMGMTNNQSASTVKPMSPADLRAQQNLQQQQTAIQQPSAPNPNAQPSTQNTQSTTRNAHPNQPSNARPFEPPGTPVNTNNPAMKRGFMQK